MLLLDVNVLVYAHRAELPQHNSIRQWLHELANGETRFGIAELSLSGFVRIVTQRPFTPVTPSEVALDFCNRLIAAPNCLLVRPTETQWKVFDRLCRRVGAKGGLVPDAYFAAMALDQDCEWITTDTDFARFPGLSWRHPLEKATTVNPG